MCQTRPLWARASGEPSTGAFRAPKSLLRRGSASNHRPRSRRWTTPSGTFFEGLVCRAWTSVFSWPTTRICWKQSTSERGSCWTQALSAPSAFLLRPWVGPPMRFCRASALRRWRSLKLLLHPWRRLLGCSPGCSDRASLPLVGRHFLQASCCKTLGSLPWRVAWRKALRRCCYGGPCSKDSSLSCTPGTSRTSTRTSEP
mmetsp:Transcript_86321/g.241410  ORF Transcript_86321/g.241410 Transcript_86321/m.241410 type:complete len:200 (+) Transcript_86321:86-685(+)